jgi:hypothetical protein
MSAGVWIWVVPGEKLNADKWDWTDQVGFLRRISWLAGLGFDQLIDVDFWGAFLEKLKSMVVDGPISCGKNQTSGFVVSCGEFWFFRWFSGDF